MDVNFSGANITWDEYQDLEELANNLKGYRKKGKPVSRSGWLQSMFDHDLKNEMVVKDIVLFVIENGDFSLPTIVVPVEGTVPKTDKDIPPSANM